MNCSYLRRNIETIWHDSPCVVPPFTWKTSCRTHPSLGGKAFSPVSGKPSTLHSSLLERVTSHAWVFASFLFQWPLTSFHLGTCSGFWHIAHFFLAPLPSSLWRLSLFVCLLNSWIMSFHLCCFHKVLVCFITKSFWSLRFTFACHVTKIPFSNVIFWLRILLQLL